LDGDGDLDIVSIAWDEPQFIHLWRNDELIHPDNISSDEAVASEPIAVELATTPAELSGEADLINSEGPLALYTFTEVAL
jgi:hypothetical protein